MSALEGLGDFVGKNRDQVDGAIEKGGDFIDEKTGNKHAEHVDKGQDFLREKARGFGAKKDVDETPTS